MNRTDSVLAAVLLASACLSAGLWAQTPMMTRLAEQYVRLVLALGEHDADYVDAYYGPPEWRREVQNARLSLAAIAGEAAVLARQLADVSPGGDADGMAGLRHQYLTRQIEALRAPTN